MSLEDKFYPEDGSNLTRYDNFMIKSAGKVGEFYQHLTGRSYKDLVKKSYQTGSALSGIASLVGMNIFFAIGSYGMFKRSKEFRCLSPLEEEIEYEIKGENKKFGKFGRAFATLGTIAITSIGCMMLKDNPEERTIQYMFGASNLLAGFSNTFFTLGEYLKMSNVPKPPKKTVFEKTKEKLKELSEKTRDLLPQPMPEPIPVRLCIEDYV